MPCKGCQNFATKYLGSPQAEGSRADEEKDPGAQPPSVAMAAMQLLRDHRITREQYQQPKCRNAPHGSADIDS